MMKRGKFGGDGSKRGIQLHLAVELYLPVQSGFQLLSFPPFGLNCLKPGNVIGKALARTGRQWDVLANNLLVKPGKIERDGQRWTLRRQRLRLRLKAGFDDPLR